MKPRDDGNQHEDLKPGPPAWRDEAMEEVWAIKEKLWREVQDLPLDEAFRERARLAEERTRAAGLGHLIVKTAGKR